MDTIAAVSLWVNLIVVLVTTWLLVSPFFSDPERAEGNDSASEAEKSRPAIAPELIALARKREMLLNTLAELEHDYLAGKVARDYYLEVKADLEQKTIECLSEIDQFSRGVPDVSTRRKKRLQAV